MSEIVENLPSRYRTRRPLKYVMYNQVCRVKSIPNGSGPVLECKETGTYFVYGNCRKIKYHTLFFLHDQSHKVVKAPDPDKDLGDGFIRVTAENYTRHLASEIAKGINTLEPIEISCADFGRGFRFTLKSRNRRRSFRGIPVIWDFTVP